MKRIIAAVAVAATALTAGGDVVTYTNPIDIQIADPFVFRENDTYYLYGTTSPDSGFWVYTSRDLVHWNREAQCYKPNAENWPQGDFWAPEVVKNGDAYWLYFTARTRKSRVRNICAARANSPLGPFTDVKAPMFPEYSLIDPHVFQDPATGKWYIYVTDEANPRQSRIMVAPLAQNTVEIEGSLADCFKPTLQWERHWVEAPLVIPHKGLYYLMYSASAYDRPSYTISYATAPSPLGPWTKHGEPIVSQTPTVQGPGHNGMAMSPDGKEMFVIYHVHRATYTVSRVLAIDRMEFVPQAEGPDLLVAKEAPSSTPQPLPSGATPMKTAMSDEFDSASLDRTRWFIFQENPNHWKMEKNAVTITAALGDFNRRRDDGENLFLQHAPDGDFDISTRVRFKPVGQHDQASLFVWQDTNNFVKAVVLESDGPRLEAGVTLQAKYDTQLDDWTSQSLCHLKIEKRGDMYSSYASPDGTTWKMIGVPVRAELRNIMVGFGAFLPNVDAQRDATFEYFHIEKK